MESQPPNSSPEVRLLPLVEGTPNEGLANLLARLLVDDEAQAGLGAQSSLLILAGVQAFLDSNGDYATAEQLWEPVIVARQLEKALGSAEAALEKATEMAKGCIGANDRRGAGIYERAAALLDAQVNKRVDNPS